MQPLVLISDATPLGDDGAAIAMLLAARRFHVPLIVATSGNVWAEEAADNLRGLLARLRRDDIGVCVGLPSAVHQTRMDYFNQIERHSSVVSYFGAFERPSAFAACAECGDLFGKIATLHKPDLLVLGPASVLAAVLRAHPDLRTNIGRLFMMGGAIATVGNATIASEFNFWFDPDAAEAVLASDLPLTLLPLDAAQHVRYPVDIKARLDPAFPPAAYLLDRLAISNQPFICDELLAAIVLDPALVVRRAALKLAVETSPGTRYGAVHVLAENAPRRPVDVVLEVDRLAVGRLFNNLFAQE
jgi:inosine-uridine nucleoside N-ribohydrolase